MTEQIVTILGLVVLALGFYQLFFTTSEAERAAERIQAITDAKKARREVLQKRANARYRKLRAEHCLYAGDLKGYYEWKG